MCVSSLLNECLVFGVHLYVWMDRVIRLYLTFQTICRSLLNISCGKLDIAKMERGRLGSKSEKDSCVCVCVSYFQLVSDLDVYEDLYISDLKQSFKYTRFFDQCGRIVANDLWWYVWYSKGRNPVALETKWILAVWYVRVGGECVRVCPTFNECWCLMYMYMKISISIN